MDAATALTQIAQIRTLPIKAEVRELESKFSEIKEDDPLFIGRGSEATTLALKDGRVARIAHVQDTARDRSQANSNQALTLALIKAEGNDLLKAHSPEISAWDNLTQTIVMSKLEGKCISDTFRDQDIETIDAMTKEDFKNLFANLNELIRLKITTVDRGRNTLFKKGHGFGLIDFPVDLNSCFITDEKQEFNIRVSDIVSRFKANLNTSSPGFAKSLEGALLRMRQGLFTFIKEGGIDLDRWERIELGNLFNKPGQRRELSASDLRAFTRHIEKTH